MSKTKYGLWKARRRGFTLIEIRLLVVRSGTTVAGYLPSWFGCSREDAASTLLSCSDAAVASMFFSL